MNSFTRGLLLAGSWSLLAGCAPGAGLTGTEMPLSEPYRPQYHFSPAQAWMNDPNGLVYHAGEYHLFYQHNPDDVVWGPMHWGHAVSRDLVHWQHLPIALSPDENGAIFSGSAVVDGKNTAGFGAEALVAIFTHADGSRQSQSLAYSLDRGRTWTKYTGNPVLPPPSNIKNFRDPKVFWYDEGGEAYWVMAVAAGNLILFYASPDLKHWQPTGGFGPGDGATCGVWETPDLFRLPVDGGPEARWVLAVAIGGCAPAGGSGVQYFVGDFDGRTFTSENPGPTTLWADWGADFYAPQSWNDAPAGRRIWAAWLSNWRYAQAVPASTWRGALTLPRELSLRTTPDGVRLVQRPISELAALRGRRWTWRDEILQPGANLLAGIAGETLEIIAEFPVAPDTAADRLGLRVRVGEGQATTIGYMTRARKLYVDRGRSGATEFSAGFASSHSADLSPVNDRLRLHIFLDRSSVEVFGNDGLTVFTESVFPAAGSLGLELFVEGGAAALNTLDIYQLEPAAFYLPEAPEK